MAKTTQTLGFAAVHVIGSLAVADGGPSYSVPRLCSALAGAVNTTLMAVAERGNGPSDNYVNGYRDRRFNEDFSDIPILRDLRYSRALHSALAHQAKQTNVLHSHGLWLAPNIAASQVAARNNLPHVITPRGMLSPVALSFSKWKKRAFWALLQERALRGAACLHATSDAEHDEIRALGLTNPIAIIPNGIDVPDLDDFPRADITSDRVVLSLGRIHPKKGLERLVRAWAMVESKAPGWRLRIVGPAERGHDLELRALVASLGISRASIEGPIYGAAKLRAFRDADLFVLPTLNENFGLTVAEALAAETPVISTVGAPWQALEEQNCGWWVNHGEESLSAALNSAIEMPREQLKFMGKLGRLWVSNTYSWDRISEDMQCVYAWLYGKQSPPECLRLN